MNHHFAADHEYLSPTSSFQQQQMTRRYGSPAGNLSTIVNGLQHNNGGGTSPGHRRKQLDQIRDSLKPFEQNHLKYDASGTEEEELLTDLQLNELEEYNELPNNLEEPSRSDGPSKEEQMICELMQFGGYDQITALCALQITGFQSVNEAAKLLLQAKQGLTKLDSIPQVYGNSQIGGMVNGNMMTVAGSSGYNSSTSVAINGGGTREESLLVESDPCLPSISSTITGEPPPPLKPYVTRQQQRLHRHQQFVAITKSLPPPLMVSHNDGQSASSSTSSVSSLSQCQEYNALMGSNASFASKKSKLSRSPSPSNFFSKIIPRQKITSKEKICIQESVCSTASISQNPKELVDARLSCCAPTVIRIGRVGDCDPHQALGMPQTSPVPSVYQLQGQQSSSKLNNKKNTTLIRTPTSPLASPKYRHHLQQDNPVSRRQTISTVQINMPDSGHEPTTPLQSSFVYTNSGSSAETVRQILTHSDSRIHPPPCYENLIDGIRIVSVTPSANNSVRSSCISIANNDNATNHQRLHDRQISDSQRCTSPLPESIARKLRSGAYEKVVKSCRPPMLRFFMEQHVEKLVQQYRERNQRLMQLMQEMEQASLNEAIKEQMLRLLRQKESKYLRLKRQTINKNMFETVRHIGVGAFGKVSLVRKKDTGLVYAMKTLKKADVINKQQVAHVKAERDILAEANSNWVVKLFFSFQDSSCLYFIMEYVPGGDMMQLLINKGIFSERLARFYIAELTNAIEYVHSLGFIHRDIKPDNILIDKDGHMKLTDFGLCTGLRWTHDKRHYTIYENDDEDDPTHLRYDSFTLPPGAVDQVGVEKERIKLLEVRQHKRRNQAHSVVGTKNYMAPEVIMKTGHTHCCDWWSIGVILYEMVFGRPPFLSKNDDPAETQFMIVHWRHYLNFDNRMGIYLSRECIDCIAMLCCDQDTRLGNHNGAKDVKAHPWFKNVDFVNIRSTKAEYIPKVEHPEDTSNFDTYDLRSEEELFRTLERRERTGGPGTPMKDFYDFTFRNFFANDGVATVGGERQGGAWMQQQQQQRPSLAPLIEAASSSQQPNRESMPFSSSTSASIVEKTKLTHTSRTTGTKQQVHPLLQQSSNRPCSSTNKLIPSSRTSPAEHPCLMEVDDEYETVCETQKDSILESKTSEMQPPSRQCLRPFRVPQLNELDINDSE